MCIIIRRPAGVVLPDSIYEKCFLEHSDGAGFAVVNGDELLIERGYFSCKRMLKDMKEFEQSEMLIHFRTGNRGKVSPLL